jgi:subtilase family serine protease
MNISSQISGVQRGATQPKTAPAGTDPQAGLPDLVIDRFDPSNGFPDQGERIDFTVRVRNRGSVAAGPFTVEVSGDGMAPDRERVPGLAAGQFTRLRFGPANVGFAGAAWYDARADVGNEVAEDSESNNWASTSVSVRDPFPRDPFPNPPRPPIPPR